MASCVQTMISKSLEFRPSFSRYTPGETPTRNLPANDGCAQIYLRQAQLSITRAETKTARIDCEASGIQNFGSAVMHWYRHRPGEAPERILYISAKKVEFDKGSDKKFDCENNPDQPISTLVVNGITTDDRAIYYCAYWDSTVLETHRQPVQKPHSVF
ncbi:RRP12-like protein [Platysternon megacephalum]|uniref:RRP12-like protein n=1 Tax=Platysternon megacephalum TaxID=55544 RepID=A0A4D9EP28_9SAUR|nr:RRP12-like protein [Platysternon megacephalum]